MSSLINAATEFARQAREVDVSESNVAPDRNSPAALYGSERDEQILELVQQLFFQPESAVRYVGVTSIDAATEIWPLCLDVAMTLAESCKREIGLVDARGQANPAIASDREVPAGKAQRLRPNLQSVSPHQWLGGGYGANLADSSLARLHAAIVNFDQTVICLDPLSWKTWRIGTVCDGLVLVVTANKTRRLVAAQAAGQLKRMGVRLLGVVLAGRRFPVPEGLYRNL